MPFEDKISFEEAFEILRNTIASRTAGENFDEDLAYQAIGMLENFVEYVSYKYPLES